MTLPRMSIEALQARLHAEPKRLLAIVEGFSERRLLTEWNSEAILPIDVYSIDEVDVSIASPFREYGGNKGRIATLFCTPPLSDQNHKNGIGVVDRDLDVYLQREISNRNITYTEFSSLLAQFFDKKSLSEIARKGLGKQISSSIFADVFRYMKMNFALRVLKEQARLTVTLPAIRRYVRPIKDGGFNFRDYTATVDQRFAAAGYEGCVNKYLKNFSYDSEIRNNIHVHDAVTYIHARLRTENLIDSSVSREEIYRHLSWMFFYYLSDIYIVAFLRKMSLTL